MWLFFKNNSVLRKKERYEYLIYILIDLNLCSWLSLINIIWKKNWFRYCKNNVFLNIFYDCDSIIRNCILEKECNLKRLILFFEENEGC